MLVSVACQAAFAVENAQLHEAALHDQALRRELDVAHEVQRGFLPSAAPRIPEYEFFEFYEPANQLGGDYYDYIELPGGRLAVVVADVSGKGVSASLLMAKLSAETRFCLASEPEPAQAMSPAQPRLLRQRLGGPVRHHGAGPARPAAARGDDPQRRPPAAALASRAGLRRAGGPVRDRPAAGRRAGGRLRARTLVRLAPGESLILYTDGITEAMNAKRRTLRLRPAAAMLCRPRRRRRRPAGPPHPRQRAALRRRPPAKRRHVPDVFWKGEGGVDLPSAGGGHSMECRAFAMHKLSVYVETSVWSNAFAEDALDSGLLRGNSSPMRTAA